MKYDLVIAHRVCPVFSTTAIGFNSKLDMVRATAQSLKEALNGITVRLVVILDGCPDEFYAIFRNFTVGDCSKVEIIRMDNAGNQATFQKQIDILSSVDDAEVVYFSEDDYLYRRNAFHSMLNFLKCPNVDFITPLDHPDRYIENIPESKKIEIRVSESLHWRRVGTTCLTFMTKVSTLRKTKDRFAFYTNGALDSTVWLSLTKDMVFNFPCLIKALLGWLLRIDMKGSILPLLVWKTTKFRVLLSARYLLWGPIPTLAVHLSSASLPPFSETFFEGEMRKEIKSAMKSYLNR